MFCHFWGQAFLLIVLIPHSVPNRLTAFSFNCTLRVVHGISLRNSFMKQWNRWRSSGSDMLSTRRKSTSWNNNIFRNRGAWKWKTSLTALSLNNWLRNWKTTGLDPSMPLVRVFCHYSRNCSMQNLTYIVCFKLVSCKLSKIGENYFQGWKPGWNSFSACRVLFRYLGSCCYYCSPYFTG